MTCYTDEILRAKFDGELTQAEAQEVDNHLAACAGCRERADNIGRQAGEVGGILAALLPPPGEILPDSTIALARFNACQRMAQPEAPSFFGGLLARRLRAAWGAVALASLIVVLVSFAPARTWAQKLLAMLRVQKIAVVPVDFTALDGSSGGTAAGKMFGRMLSENVVVTIHGQSQSVANADEASQSAGYKIRLLSSRTDAPKLTVEGEQAFHLTVDRERVQSILDEAGRSDLTLPPSVDGATIAVHIPAAVVARYGNCPSEIHKKDAPNPQQTPPGNDAGTKGSGGAGADVSDCVVVAQVPSPTVNVPPDLNVAQLVEVGLQAGGMSAEQAHNFSQTVDWTSTLVLPIPRFVNSYQTVSVDGVEGTLIDMPRLGSRRPAGYALMWVKSGVIYSIMGFGNSSNAMPLAETLN